MCDSGTVQVYVCAHVIIRVGVQCAHLTLALCKSEVQYKLSHTILLPSKYLPPISLSHSSKTEEHIEGFFSM
jgi:hypothetical protein